MERIDITVDPAELERNEEKQERLRKTRSFEPTDRVPVLVNTNQWTALAARGRRFADYIRSPKDNLREQILNAKWRIEQVWDDRPIPTDRLSFQPDLGCLRGVEFEMDIHWSEDLPPKCMHPLTEPEQIDALEVPDPSGGLNARRIEWYEAMAEARADFDVRLNGEPLEVNVTLSQPGGPIPSAFALAGVNLYIWMVIEPERTHRLMDIVTESHMRGVRFFDEMMGRPVHHPVGLGFDAGEIIGPEMFKTFVVPYYLKIWETYGGPRGFHNCGQNDHLLALIRDELQITSHNGFGSCVNPEVLAREMAGRVQLLGGTDSTLLLSGTPSEIAADTRRYIQTLGKWSGYIFSCGGGAAPGTPIEHYQVMVDASREIGSVYAGGD